MTTAAQMPKQPPIIPGLSRESRRWFDAVTTMMKILVGRIDLSASEPVIYFGNKDTDGAWRIIVSDDKLIIQRRVSSAWVTKHEVV